MSLDRFDVSDNFYLLNQLQLFKFKSEGFCVGFANTTADYFLNYKLGDLNLILKKISDIPIAELKSKIKTTKEKHLLDAVNLNQDDKYILQIKPLFKSIKLHHEPHLSPNIFASGNPHSAQDTEKTFSIVNANRRTEESVVLVKKFIGCYTHKQINSFFFYYAKLLTNSHCVTSVLLLFFILAIMPSLLAMILRINIGNLLILILG